MRFRIKSSQGSWKVLKCNGKRKIKPNRYRIVGHLSMMTVNFKKRTHTPKKFQMREREKSFCLGRRKLGGN